MFRLQVHLVRLLLVRDTVFFFYDQTFFILFSLKYIAPSAKPSYAPTAAPTISSPPTIAPTATPTVGAKTKSTELTIFLEGVSGTLSLKSANAFNSVTKEVLQDTLTPSDGNVSFEFIYVQIINQEFIEGGGEDRRALEEETLGSLKLDLKIVASVLPGDYDGFDEDVGGFFVNSANTDILDAELRKEADFYDFVPVSVVDGDDSSIDDGSIFSGNVVIGILFGSAGVIGLVYVYYGKKRGRFGSLEKKNSAGSSTDEEIGASASEESIEVQYPKGTDPTSPGNESKNSKFTGFSTGAMCNGAGNFQLRKSSIPKSFFFSRKGDIETDVCQPTMCQPKMLQSSSTDSGLFDIARKCGAPPMTKVRSNDTDVGIFMTDSIVEKESFVHEEMTAIEAILE